MPDEQATKFEVGDNVKVRDQIPTVIGTVRKVSNWLAVNGAPSSGDDTCYLVKVDEWARPFWIGAPCVRAIEEE